MKNYFLSAKQFAEYFNIPQTHPNIDLLSAILNAFKKIPYENISKIIKSNGNKSFGASLRLPDTIISEHILYGLGGTCFSLTFFLKQILDYMGFKSNLLLADRTYGNSTHCCISVELGEDSFLADIGYLIFQPQLMPKNNGDIACFSYGQYDFKAIKQDNNINMYSVITPEYKKFRYKIKLQPVNNDIFFDAWKESFKLENMNHIIINAYSEENHIYIKDHNFHKNAKQIKAVSETSIISKLGIPIEHWIKAKSILNI